MCSGTSGLQKRYTKDYQATGDRHRYVTYAKVKHLDSERHTDAENREEHNVDEQLSQRCADRQLLIVLDLLSLAGRPQRCRQTTSFTTRSTTSLTY